VSLGASRPHRPILFRTNRSISDVMSTLVLFKTYIATSRVQITVLYVTRITDIGLFWIASLPALFALTCSPISSRASVYTNQSVSPATSKCFEKKTIFCCRTSGRPRRSIRPQSFRRFFSSFCAKVSKLEQHLSNIVGWTQLTIMFVLSDRCQACPGRGRCCSSSASLGDC
jgi:hypothetical protein